MNQRTKYILIGVGFLILLFVVIGLGSYVKSNAPQPPTPTVGPTATPAPITVTGLGGPMLNDPDVRAVLASPWTDKNGEELPPVIPDTTYANTSTSKMNTWGADPVNNKPADYTGIDFAWHGDTYYANQFPGKYLQKQVVFNTKLMMFTWWRHLPAFEKAGYAVKVDNYYEMPVDKACQLLEYQYEGKAWREVGIIFDDDRYTDSLIDLNGSDPVSSTGIEQMAWMANCFANQGKMPADLNQYDLFMPKLITYAHQQGAQGKGSLSSFSEFMSSGEGTVTFIGYDSAFPTVANENGWTPELIKCLSTNPQNTSVKGCKKENRLVGVYLGKATNASHTYLALTPNGQLLLRRLADPRIQKIVWEKLGMTTPATFLYDAPISWMSTTVQVGDKPRDEVYTAIIKGLNDEFKPKQ